MPIIRSTKTGRKIVFKSGSPEGAANSTFLSRPKMTGRMLYFKGVGGNNIIFTQPLTFNTGEANHGRVYYKTLTGEILGTGFTAKRDSDLVDSDFPNIATSKWDIPDLVEREIGLWRKGKVGIESEDFDMAWQTCLESTPNGAGLFCGIAVNKYSSRWQISTCRRFLISNTSGLDENAFVSAILELKIGANYVGSGEMRLYSYSGNWPLESDDFYGEGKILIETIPVSSFGTGDSLRINIPKEYINFQGITYFMVTYSLEEDGWKPPQTAHNWWFDFKRFAPREHYLHITGGNENYVYDYLFQDGYCNGGSLPTGITYDIGSDTYLINSSESWMVLKTVLFKKKSGTQVLTSGSVLELVNSAFAYMRAEGNITVGGYASHINFGEINYRKWKADGVISFQYCTGTLISPADILGDEGRTPLMWAGRHLYLSPGLNTKGLISCANIVGGSSGNLTLGGNAIYESSFLINGGAFFQNTGTIIPSYVVPNPKDTRCGLAIIAWGLGYHGLVINAQGWTINGLVFNNSSGSPATSFIAGTVNGELVARGGVSFNNGIVNYSKDYRTQIKAHYTNFFSGGNPNKLFYGR